MALGRNVRSKTVEACGVTAGSVLRGSGIHNQGLRLKVLHDHPRGDGGPLKGAFVILDAGDNVHTHLLEHPVGRATTADEVARLIRRDNPSCVNVANANILRPEPA